MTFNNYYTVKKNLLIFIRCNIWELMRPIGPIHIHISLLQVLEERLKITIMLTVDLE